MGVCTKERKGVTAEVLMATPCTNSLVAFGARTISFFSRERRMCQVRGIGANHFLAPTIPWERRGLGLGSHETRLQPRCRGGSRSVGQH